MTNKSSIFSRLSLAGAVILFGGLLLLANSSVNNAKENHTKQLKERLTILADTIVTSVHNMMITGNAGIVSDWVKGLKKTHGIEVVQILRADGVEAFSDNKTIEAVNRYLKSDRFEKKSSLFFQKDNEFEGFNICPVNKTKLEEVFKTSANRIFLEDGKNGKTLTILRPVPRVEECSICHGYDTNSVRGVVRISISAEGIDAERAEMIENELTLSITVALAMFLVFGAYAFTLIQKVKKGEEEHKISSKVFNSTVEGIMITDLNGTITSVNPALEVTTGYSKKELLGKKPSILKSKKHEKDFYHKMLVEMQKNGRWVGEIWSHRKNGEEYPQHLSISSIDDDGGKVSHYVGVSRDITEQKEHEERVEFMAFHDNLTGLPNRRTFDKLVEVELAHAKRYGYIASVMFIDLDGFKAVNDIFGHEAGDKLLKEVSAMFVKAVREGDTVTRMGGDEFIILLPQIKQRQDVKNIGDKIVGLFQKPIVVDGNELNVGTSIGISMFPDDGNTPATLVRNADEAMYSAKKAGKNRCLFYNHE